MKKIIFAVVVAMLFAVTVRAEIIEDFAKIKGISDSVCVGATSNEEKVIALSHYVYMKLKPDASKGIEPFAQLSTTDRLESGVGWCNHQIAVFMRLAEQQHIKTRMLYLTDSAGESSPHTIGEAWIGGRWVIIDPMFDQVLRNEKGELASLRDVYKNKDILKTVPLIQARLEENYHGDEAEFENWIDNYLNPVIFVYGLE